MQRLNQVLKDEGVVDDSFFSEGVEYLKSIQKIPSYTRNPFEALKHGTHKLLTLLAPALITFLEAMVILNLDFKENSVNLVGFEEPHLRRESKKFSFERNKKKVLKSHF